MNTIATPKDLILLSIINSSLSGNLFGYTSKDTSWGDGDIPPEIDPTPIEVLEEILFTKRIDTNSIKVLIDRIDWSSGLYSEGDIVFTSENHLYKRTQLGTSDSEPVHTSGVEENWEFISILTPDEVLYYVDENYVPLDWSSEKLFWTDLPKRIRILFRVISDEDGKFPIDLSYRIAGLYVNPFNRLPQNDERQNSSFGEYGRLLCIDTFTPVIRTPEGINVHSFDVILPS